MNSKIWELQIEIETTCALNCVHCSSLEMRTFGQRIFSDQELIDFLKLFNSQIYIYFTGGDPICYNNLISLCNSISTLIPQSKIGLYSTGNNLSQGFINDDYAYSLKEAGVVDCYFSIYSNIESEHDNWTNIEGSFVNTLKSVKSLLNNGIHPKAHIILTKINHNKIEDIIKFCKTHGFVELRILRLSNSGSAKNNWSDIGMPIEQQNEIIYKLIQLVNTYDIKISFSGYPNLHPCRAFENAKGCQAGTNLLYVDSFGNIYPCACTKQYNTYKICNITELDKVSSYINSAIDEYRSECFQKGLL